MDIINTITNEELNLLTKNQLFLLLFKSTKDELLELIKHQRLSNKTMLQFKQPLEINYPKKYRGWLSCVNTVPLCFTKIDNCTMVKLLCYARGYEQFHTQYYQVVANEYLSPIPNDVEIFIFLTKGALGKVTITLSIINYLPKNFDLSSVTKIDELFDTKPLNAYWSDHIYDSYNPYIE